MSDSKLIHEILGLLYIYTYTPPIIIFAVYQRIFDLKTLESAVLVYIIACYVLYTVSRLVHLHLYRDVMHVCGCALYTTSGGAI